MILPRRVLRRLITLGIITFFLFNILWMVLPGDNVVLLAIRFNVVRFFGLFRGSVVQKDAWLWKPAKFEVDIRRDVGLLIKTGYGTRERLPAQLEAFRLEPQDSDNVFIVVGDFAQRNLTEGEVVINDAVGNVLRMKENARLDNSPRFAKYHHLEEAINDGNERRAKEIGRSFGWELDALKFIWGLNLAYTKLPPKKWYIILDDDTYLIKPSLQLILNHLDHTKPQYLGNAVGDFKGRFAHGGSAVILSAEAVKRLFDRPDIVMQAHFTSLTEVWGDKLIATTFQKLGIYLDERYSHFFNGERPTITRVMADRFCSPLLSFHGLSNPDEMRQVGLAFAKYDKPVFWSNLWSMYGGPDLTSFRQNPVRAQQDHVGGSGEHITTLRGVKSAKDCVKQCGRSWRKCLAWTWEEKDQICRLAPWMIIGDKPEGKYSGVNLGWAQKLAMDCSS